MAIADVAIIVIVALCALLGLLFGTGKSFISIIGWGGSFIIALFLTGTIAYALISVPFIEGMVFDFLAEVMRGVTVGVPNSGILGVIFNPLTDSVARLYAGAAAEAASRAVFAYAIYSLIVCLALFLIIRLVMMLVTWILKKIILRSGKKPSPVSRLGGFVLGGVKGAMFAGIAFILLSFGMVLAVPNAPLAAVANDIDKSFIAKPAFTFLAPLSGKMLAPDDSKLDARIKEIVQKSGVLEEVKEEYTVIFETGEGASEIDMHKLPAGDQITEEPVPEKSGYFFEGWYRDAGFSGDRVQFPYTMEAENITLYAKWTAAYTVTFAPGEGASVVNPQTLRAGDQVAQEPVPEKDGYVFGGWYRDAGFAGDRVVFPLIIGTENITLYAKWSPDLSPEQQAVFDMLSGDNSILYTLGGGKENMESTYFREGMPVNYIDEMLVLAFDEIAGNVYRLTGEQIAQMQALLSPGGNVYVSLEVLLGAIQDYAEQGNLQNVGNPPVLEWVVPQQVRTALENAEDGLAAELMAMYIAFDWEIHEA